MTNPQDIIHLDGASLDIAAEKRNELLKLFPEARAEGGKVDFEHLKLALGETVSIGKERFGLNWPGRSSCFKTIQEQSKATLLPLPDRSVNFEASQNLVIEGDNLEVLKLLQKSYLGKVKMIYIDPPYNTGNDFIYPDNYSESLETYLEYTGQVDVEGRKFGTNTETDGRFHSKWLNMMYPRLYLARNLLRDDGVIFISINDVELSTLLAICNDLFGEENHLCTFVWLNDGNIDNQSKIKTKHEYIVAFARNETAFPAPAVIDPNIPESSKLFRDHIENTIVKNGPANPVSTVVLPAGFPADFAEGIIEPKPDFWPRLERATSVKDSRLAESATVSSGWSSKELLEEFIGNGCNPIFDSKAQETTFFVTKAGTIISKKRRSADQSHVLSELRGMGTVQSAAGILRDLGIKFPYPKPVGLIKYLIQVGSSPGDLIIDFFAGSGTLGEATFELNAASLEAERKFILVQLPEATADEENRTISAIAESRLKKIIARRSSSSENTPSLLEAKHDNGFRMFALAESNVRAWNASLEHDVSALDKQMALGVDHLLPGRRDIDIVYEVMLKEGFELSSFIEREEVGGKTIYSIADGAFIICLDRRLDLNIIKAIAERKPARVLFLDEGFDGNDQLKTNAVQTFKSKDVVFKAM